MLLVNASAGPSLIQGTGLIAREFIAAGTLVWVLQPGFDLEFLRADLDELSVYGQEQIRRFLYVDRWTGKYVLCGDDARFMNHSQTPNTRTDGPRTTAICDIQPGDELTANYAEFDAAWKGLSADSPQR